MWWLIAPVILITLVVYVGGHTFHKAMAREEADRIITGKQSATDEQLNKCMARIRQQSYWFRDVTELDNQRINRLRDMRKEMVTPYP